MFFWLLDINHEVVKDNVEIRLWGKDSSGCTVLVVTEGTPYFYILPKEEMDLENALRKIEAECGKHKEIVKTELVGKRYFGKSVKAVRVLCKTPEAVEKYSRLLSKTLPIGEHLEDDIRPATRYILENSVSPSGWYDVEASRVVRPGLHVDQIYRAVKPPTLVERLEAPNLRTLAFSILCMSEKGSPDPSRDPVLAITIAPHQGRIEQLVSDGRDDREILETFTSRIGELDPDVILGYGQNTFDWPYLIERAKRQKARLPVDRMGSEPHRSVYGHISVTGRANIDLADVSHDIPEVKLKTLGSVAEFLQVAKRVDIDRFQDAHAGELWRSLERRRPLLENQQRRAEASLKIGRILLDSMIQMSNVTGLPLDQVAAAAVGHRVDSYLMMQAYRLNELIPRRTEQPYTPYQGATVLEPKPGVHENVAVLDFTSMYPNLMIINNLSPDSYVGDESIPDGEVIVAPEVGYRFRREPPGFYRRVLEYLIAIRRDVKQRLEKADPNSVEYRVLREREKAIKVVTNACYGYAGWVGARWYVREVAESAAAFGRATLRRVLQMAESLGLAVIYADTDSVFVKYDRSKIERLLREVESETGMEIKIDKIYIRVLFTEAKKKYAGLLPNQTLDIVGLEAVRGDWPNAVRLVQEGILKLVLSNKNIEEAVEFLRTYVQKMRLGEVPLSDFIVWKTLIKPVEAYRVKTPHVEAAKTLLRDGWNLKVGDKVGFIIVKGSGRLHERARPYLMASIDQVDVEYYISSQVLPAAMRVLGMFGLKEDAVLGSADASSLSRYIGQD
ncbi:DNA polymerase II [Candidatus Bathyarchaeota archaeon]|nr:DNA polymerase II [Candidatus Bathyarchaeota archaeon]